MGIRVSRPAAAARAVTMRCCSVAVLRTAVLRHRQHLHTYVLGSVRAHTVRYQAWGGLVIITMCNLVCHMLYSIPAAFFPLEASMHGMSSDGVGAHFALFAVVIIFLAPWAVVHMRANGAIATYRLGLLLISCATIAFSPAILFSKWWEPLFAWWSNAMMKSSTPIG